MASGLLSGAGSQPPRRPVLVAPVSGFAAWLLAPVLVREAPRLAELAACNGFPPELIAQVRAAVAAVRAAGQEWEAWRASVDGNAEVVDAETPAGLGHDVCTDQAAAMLGVSPRRVRQLLEAGRLAGHKSGGVWLVSVDSARALREARRAA